MPITIHTHLLPQLFEPHELQNSTAIVIDVLRASTTICHALAANANVVIPCQDVDETRRLAEQLREAGEPIVLGGERHRQLIDGFDLDNSPFNYTPETVSGKTVLFTTTNGTNALARAAQADQLFIGTFNNLTAIVQQLLGDNKTNSNQNNNTVHLVCAGTDGKITGEDILFAGAVIEQLFNTNPDTIQQDDSTRLAHRFFKTATAATNHLQQTIHHELQKTLGGRNLINSKMNADIERAAEIDRFHFAPRYSPQTNRITITNDIRER